MNLDLLSMTAACILPLLSLTSLAMSWRERRHDLRAIEPDTFYEVPWATDDYTLASPISFFNNIIAASYIAFTTPHRTLTSGVFLFDAKKRSTLPASLIRPREIASKQGLELKTAMDKHLLAIGDSRFVDNLNDTRGQIFIYQVTDPRNPVRLSRLKGNGIGRTVAMSNGILATSNSQHVYIYSIKDPANPRIASSISSPQHTEAIELHGQFLAVRDPTASSNNIDGAGLLRLYDVSDPDDPKPLSSISSTHPTSNAYFPRQFALSDGLVAVLDQPTNCVLVYEINRSLQSPAYAFQIESGFREIKCIALSKQYIAMSTRSDSEAGIRSGGVVLVFPLTQDNPKYHRIVPSFYGSKGLRGVRFGEGARSISIVESTIAISCAGIEDSSERIVAAECPAT